MNLLREKLMDYQGGAIVIKRLKENRKIVVYALAAVVLIAGAVYYHNIQESRHQQAVTLTQEALQNINTLQNKLHVSEQNAQALQDYVKKINTGQVQPVTNYYVQAPTVQAAADKVQYQIKNHDQTLPPAALEKTDRTVVTPNTDKQKVDVYKIDLDKPRGVGVYVSSQSYGAMVQYKNVVGFGGPRFQGGYEVGVGYVIRF